MPQEALAATESPGISFALPRLRPSFLRGRARYPRLARRCAAASCGAAAAMRRPPPRLAEGRAGRGRQEPSSAPASPPAVGAAWVSSPVHHGPRHRRLGHCPGPEAPGWRQNPGGCSAFWALCWHPRRKLPKSLSSRRPLSGDHWLAMPPASAPHGGGVAEAMEAALLLVAPLGRRTMMWAAVRPRHVSCVAPPRLSPTLRPCRPQQHGAAAFAQQPHGQFHPASAAAPGAP